MNILLIEDDPLLGESARIGLGQRGFVVHWVKTLLQAQSCLSHEDYDCILLDLSLPDGDGLSYLQQLRRQGKNTAVLIITARDEIEARIQGLEAGADDYIVKPYSLDEVAARVRAVIRRLAGRASNRLEAGGLVLEPDTGTVWQNDKAVHLSATELKLLTHLMQHAGRIRSRSQLEQVLQGGEERESRSNALDVHIHHLRKKLGARTIKTVRGLGYMLMKDDL